MLRRLTLSALLLTAACGDDPDPQTTDAGSFTPQPDATVNPGTDAGVTPSNDAGSPAGDASTTPVKPNQVTNVGKECTAPAACTGEKPTCVQSLTLLQQQLPFPGGYCSATCTDTAECGQGGECPVGESLKTIPAMFRSLLSGAVPSNCYQSCTDDTSCRSSAGYRCTTVLDALNEAGGGGLGQISSFLSGPIKTNKYCLPPSPQAPDGGASPLDGGASPLDGGAGDAGMARDAAADAATDARVGDARAPDAAGDV